MDLEDIPVDSVQAALLYRFAREAMTNILKHAQPGFVQITLKANAEFIFLRIHDDGAGFNPGASAPTGHLGMRIMRDSISDSGGCLDIRSGIGKGTTLTANLPVSPYGVMG